MAGSLLFGFVTQTDGFAPHNLYRLVSPLQINVDHCAKAWGMPYPATAIIDDVDKMPGGMTPVVFVGDDTDPGTIAVHFPDGFSRVHVDRTAAVDVGDDSTCNAAGHELCEALVDLPCDLWMPHPTRAGLEVAKEVCDPCQDAYDVTTVGQTFSAANFVLPSWFDPNGQSPFDYAGRFTRPGEVGPRGYVILRDQTGAAWMESADGRFEVTAAKLMSLIHPMSRTNKRLRGLFRGPT